MVKTIGHYSYNQMAETTKGVLPPLSEYTRIQIVLLARMAWSGVSEKTAILLVTREAVVFPVQNDAYQFDGVIRFPPRPYIVDRPGVKAWLHRTIGALTGNLSLYHRGTDTVFPDGCNDGIFKQREIVTDTEIADGVWAGYLAEHDILAVRLVPSTEMLEDTTDFVSDFVAALVKPKRKRL